MRRDKLRTIGNDLAWPAASGLGGPTTQSPSKPSGVRSWVTPARTVTGRVEPGDHSCGLAAPAVFGRGSFSPGLLVHRREALATHDPCVRAQPRSSTDTLSASTVSVRPVLVECLSGVS
jgi:hypothetical protein